MPAEARRLSVRVLGASLAWVLAVAAVLAGLGWLYLLAKLHAFDVGPHQAGALPLEQLASKDQQPLGRMALAWLPAGAAATLALTLVGRVSPVSAPVGVGLLAAAIMYVTTAVSDALARNEPLADHFGPAARESGLWSAVALILLGSLVAATAVWTARRDRGTVASGA